MVSSKADTIAQLKKDLLVLQGLKSVLPGCDILPLGPLNRAFPEGRFAIGSIHEFIVTRVEDSAATWGFISAIASKLMQRTGLALWISSHRNVFPTALLHFGIEPDRMLFIDLNNDDDCLWAAEEALKCDGIAAVICEAENFSFTASRRLQLAVEKSRVTGFILRQTSKKINTTVSVARWKVSPLPGSTDDNMPGVGFPRWKVELLKVRNGKPAVWEIEYRKHELREIEIKPVVIHEIQRKVS